VFIPTTCKKFVTAEEINDLFHESSLEDQLWDALKERQIRPERQEQVTVNDRDYFLDFAIYCARGKLDVETDGDHWHANPEKAELDNLRDNDLESAGWQQLRFTERQINEQTAEYCIPKIVKTIKKLGGLEEEGKFMPRKSILTRRLAHHPAYLTRRYEGVAESQLLSRHAREASVGHPGRRLADHVDNQLIPARC
jgi:very-short-patch-repair endonuclease